jgi:hypothetical protein
MHLATITLQRRVALLMLCGWRATKIGPKVGKTPRAVRYLVGTPEFQATYAKLEAEVLDVEDRRVRRLWPTTVRRLLRLLNHRDPRIALDAIDQVHDMLGPILERHIAQALERPAGSRPGTAPATLQRTIGMMQADELMSDESRDLARKLLQSIRRAQAQPDVPSQITARVAAINGPDQN